MGGDLALPYSKLAQAPSPHRPKSQLHRKMDLPSTGQQPLHQAEPCSQPGQGPAHLTSATTVIGPTKTEVHMQPT